jgi:hypothetical protein
MNKIKFNRRLFLRSSAIAAAGMALTGTRSFSGPAPAAGNKLPKWKGFNLLDFFSPVPPRNPESSRTTGDDLKWMSGWGFDFVRIPMAYPRYL